MGGAWSGGEGLVRGESGGLGGCLLKGGACSGEGVPALGGAWWRDPLPPDGYCCGRYPSYWNAFLYFELYAMFFLKKNC